MIEKESFSNNCHLFINVISSYLHNASFSATPIDNKTLQFFFKIAKHHSMTALLFKLLDTIKIEDNNLICILENQYLANVRKTVLFNKERTELFAYLNTNDIDYLPLKGIILKDYYPEESIREFADNDVLFDEGKDELVKEFFVKKNYEIKEFKKGNHDVYLKKPFFNFEMHRSLFGEDGDNQKIVLYFKDYLKKSKIREGKEHFLTDEDFYIYFTAHTYKHFHVSGCGFRTLVDYYLFLRNKELDFKYINKELNKIGLLGFSNQIKTLANKLFDNKPLDANEEEVFLFIASSGTYGTLEHSIEKKVKEKGKFKYLVSRVFPPPSFYKYSYPWAYKCWALIPVAWISRFFRILFRNPKNIRTEISIVKKQKKNSD